MSWKDDVRDFFHGDERHREGYDRDRGRDRGYGDSYPERSERDRSERGYGESFGSQSERDRFGRDRYSSPSPFGNESHYRNEPRYGSEPRYSDEWRYGNDSRYGSREGYGDRNRDSISGGSMERERHGSREGTSEGAYGGRDWERDRDRDFGSSSRNWDRGGYESRGPGGSGRSHGYASSRYSGEHDRYVSGRHSGEADFGSTGRLQRGGGYSGRFAENDRYAGSRDHWSNEGGDFSSNRGHWSRENERMSGARYGNDDRWNREVHFSDPDRDDDWRRRR